MIVGNINRKLARLLNLSVVATLLCASLIASLPAGTARAYALPSRGEETLSIRSSFSPYTRKPTREGLRWADEQLRRMTLDEKIGQLVSVGINATYLNQESAAYRALRHQVEDNHIGGIILFQSPVYEAVHLMNRMQALARYPLLISADLERGAAMRFDDVVDFGWVMAVAATGNTDYARREGQVTAREARALGVQQVLAPVADVNNNAANPVINVRSFGEDPEQVGKFVAAFVEGLQSGGVIATAKHFPGHGNTTTDSHRGLPVFDVGRERLRNTEFVPFRAAINAGVGSVMVAHIALPQIDPTQVNPLPANLKIKPVDTTEAEEITMQSATVPASMSPVVVDILRRDLGFDGLIVTDALGMSGLTVYFTQEEAAVRALLAGADILLKPADVDACIRGVRDAVKSGRLTEKRIEESARKILAAKYDLGLVKQRLTNIDEIDSVVGSPESVKLAQEIAEHAITLVRNDAHLLPLNGLRHEARIFNLAITNGDDRLWVAAPFSSALAAAGNRVETIVLDERSSETEVQKAIERASSADLVIASLYARVRTGQARSIAIPEQGARALQALIDRNASLIGISFGNPYLLENIPKLQTYMVAYGDMRSLQQAAARAISGEIDITGRLPISLSSLYARGTGIQLKAKARPQTSSAH
ncbi:MAG TPA: glycoside hydrolase family 3 N-terminal domain-containing protein [Pyrinomonadaceae bacterium]|nr:glycoside hydrolase family 3 N-terminal domain-containing protein [Pyrinomonadaceae bacterium]